MSAVAKDIPAVVGNWSPQDKKCALAVLLRELANSESKPVVIEDEKKLTVGLFYPTGCVVTDSPEAEDLDMPNRNPVIFLMPSPPRTRPFDMTQSTPYVEEIRRRLATADQSIPIDELNEILDLEADQLNPK